MERPQAWKHYTAEQLEALDAFAEDYKGFISANKTERECAASITTLAREAGYRDLDELVEQGEALHAGDKVYASVRGKSIVLMELGRQPLSAGMNILCAHIDSPRLDVKQNPLEEKGDLARLDTHYYGGIKKYQWATIPLALHGVIVKKDGSVVTVRVGEDPQDPVLVISDLLIHLAQKQMEKKASEVIEGEMLDVICGNRPLIVEGADDASQKTPVKAYLLEVLKERYGIEEEDLLSAELEVVPAGPARDLGLDRSMVLGYGQDDRSCAYPCLRAQLSLTDVPERCAVTIFTDKEEIGSVGATGMRSVFFENIVAEVAALAGEGSSLALRRALSRSRVLSCDVSSAFDPGFPEFFETKNAALLGRGVAFLKFTGARGKSGSNDADAEYIALLRRTMDEAGVCWQTAELGRVDVGGGGTIAYMLAHYGMRVIDCGLPVISMHAPWETISKADLFEAWRAYKAFLAIA